jgi:hypothetical protein
MEWWDGGYSNLWGELSEEFCGEEWDLDWHSRGRIREDWSIKGRLNFSQRIELVRKGCWNMLVVWKMGCLGIGDLIWSEEGNELRGLVWNRRDFEKKGSSCGKGCQDPPRWSWERSRPFILGIRERTAGRISPEDMCEGRIAWDQQIDTRSVFIRN